MKQGKISFDEYLKTDAVISEEAVKQDVFEDTPKKFDFTVFFLCIIAAVCVGFTYFYYAYSYVPINDKVDISYVSTSSESDVKTDKININTADIDTLCKLKGIGENKALSIVAYRTANGDFKSIAEIKNVSGIGDAIYKDIKDKICV